MSEEQAAHYKDAVKVEGLARDQEELGLDVLDSTSDLNRSPRTS
jgi:hypothetical protein